MIGNNYTVHHTIDHSTEYVRYIVLEFFIHSLIRVVSHHEHSLALAPVELAPVCVCVCVCMCV
jgi:uncharacterized membrane protein